MSKTYPSECAAHGSTVRYFSNRQCKTCLAEKKKQRREEDGDRVRAVERSLYQRGKANVETWIGRPLKNAKARSKQFGVPFDLDHQYLLSIWTGRCAVFGTELHISQTHSIDDQATLDRIVPSLGYVRGNVAFLSNRANRIKNDATAEQIMQVAQWLLRAGTQEPPQTT